MPSNWLDDYFGPGGVQDESTDLPKRPVLAFLGASVVAADDPTNKRTTVTIAPTALVADGTGFSNITGNVKNTSNPKVVAIQYPINTTVGAASATVIGTYATASSKTYSVRGIVAVANSPGSAYGEWEINCYAVNNGGVLTIVGTPVTQKVNVSGFVVTFTVSGTNLVLTVTDPTGARRWTGEIYIAERSF